MANEPAKVMEVCTTCGALLVVGDPHQRLDEHVSGKQHKGFAQIRTYLDQRRLLESDQPIIVDRSALSSVSHKVLCFIVPPPLGKGALSVAFVCLSAFVRCIHSK